MSINLVLTLKRQTEVPKNYTRSHFYFSLFDANQDMIVYDVFQSGQLKKLK